MLNQPPHKRMKSFSAEVSEEDKITKSFSMVVEEAELDTRALNKFSRQNAALGAETTAKLIKMKVLIIGARGVGVETAKNLALQGAGMITIVDSETVKIQDLGVNFFLNEQDVSIGANRAEAIVPRLQELNPLCKVICASQLSDELILQQNAVVITSVMSLAELVRINRICRSAGVSFFFAFTGGVHTSVFTDHGDHHAVIDPNGEKPVQKLIVDIKQLSNAELLIRYDHASGQLPVTIGSGNFEITEVVGLEGINGCTFKVSRDSSDPVKTVRVSFDASSSASKYISGGLLTEKKLPLSHPMRPLMETIKVPGSTWADPPTLVLTDLINFGSELQQHVALVATLKYAEEHAGQLPRANNVDAASTVLEIAKNLLKNGHIVIEDFELNEAFVKRYALHAGSELQALASFTGGVLAQEVVKCTGKFTPIPGFMHFSAPEALPSSESLPPADTMPRGSRYDELASVFGWGFVERLGDLKYFMVGCGALGCEFMKNFALNGICCGPGGKLVVTDADRIELSNLTRQFLFREHNVGQPKSRAAASMATVMNPSFKVESMELFVGPKTEGNFNDEFWIGLDGVCNALDNMEARLYVDKQCVKYEKSLLESGTMGTSGNIDTICPFKTRTYREGGNAVEGGGVPMCTLRNFPQITDHCIEWARDQFALLFTKLVKYAEAYLSDPATFEREILGLSEKAQAIFTVRSVLSILKAVANPTIGSAAQAAFDIFHFLFRDKILDLQNTYPADSRIIGPDGIDKGPFWGEKKRYPKIAVFDTGDEAHVSFLLSTTCLFAVAIGLVPAKEEADDKWLQNYRGSDFIIGISKSLSVPDYVHCPVSTEEEASSSAGVGSTEKAVVSTIPEKGDEVLNKLFAELSSCVGSIDKSRSFMVADFEKDDDQNFHIEFITATANLRCDNYSIRRTDFQSCKVIAGKIIAAIATTTAAVCGLVILELFKLQQDKPTDSYMNRQIGLAVNNFTSFSAEAPQTFSTFTESVFPGVEDELPTDAYDANGVLKDSYVTKTVKRAYPEKHSVWDKITCSGSLTLKQFSDWLRDEHKLKLVSWDFIIGYNTVKDEDDKKVGTAAVTSPVYPPKPVLDYSLLPTLDLTIAQATQAIMRTAKAKPTQQYIALWRECKAAGHIPDVSGRSSDEITEATTVREILARMEALGLAAEADRKVDSRTVTHISDRKFWVIPGPEAPTCVHAETGEEIAALAALKCVF